MLKLTPKDCPIPDLWLWCPDFDEGPPHAALDAHCWKLHVTYDDLAMVSSETIKKTELICNAHNAKVYVHDISGNRTITGEGSLNEEEIEWLEILGKLSTCEDSYGH